MIQWFLGFFFFTLFFGMSPMEISAILLCFLILFKMWQSKKQNSNKTIFYANGFDWVFIVWLLVIAAGFLVKGQIDQIFISRLLEFKWMAFLYLIVFAFMRVGLSENIIPWTSLVASAAGFYTIGVSLAKYDPIRKEVLDAVVVNGLLARSGGLYSHAMTLAHCYGMILCWFLGLAFTYVYQRRAKSIWLLLVVISLGSGVLLTFTRGVWAALIIAVISMAFLFKKRIGLAAIILTSIVLVTLYNKWGSFHDRINQSFSTTGYDSERVWIWKANWEIFKDNPILGVGYGNNSMMLPEYYAKMGAPANMLISHAHNQYLHFMAGTGFLGLLVFLITIFYFFKLSLKIWQVVPKSEAFDKGLSLGIIGAQITFMVGGFTEANFESAKVKYMLTTTWAMALWLSYKYKILKEKVR